MLDLYLIRHAQSEANINHHLIGGRSNESPLSEKGELQASLLGQRLKHSNIVFDEIYSSTARRTIETSRIAGTHAGYSLDEVVKTDEILEFDQGGWQGKTRVEVYTPEILAQINSDNWNFTPPGGESQRKVEERMLNWVNETIISRYNEDLRVGVFSHGMAIKCLLRGIMQFSPSITHKINLFNTSITRLTYSEKGWYIVTINDTAHLQSLPLEDVL